MLTFSYGTRVLIPLCCPFDYNVASLETVAVFKLCSMSGDFMCPLALHSVKIALKGFLTLIHKCIDPVSPPHRHPPSHLLFLLDLFSSAPPSTKGNSGVRSLVHCAVVRPAVCRVRFLCMCVSVSNICEMNDHSGSWHFLMCRCHMLFVNFLTEAMPHGCHGCHSRALFCTSDFAFAHVCAQTRSSFTGDAMLALLCQCLWAGIVVMCVNVRLRFVCVIFGVKTRLPVLFVLVEFSRINCFVIFWVKIQ